MKIRLRHGGNDPIETTFQDFLKANDGFENSEVQAMQHQLQADGVYYGGGGAQPKWSLELVEPMGSEPGEDFPEHERIGHGDAFESELADIKKRAGVKEEAGSIGQQIFARVIEAMQDAEEIGGPEGQDYLDLMQSIAAEAQRRMKTYSQNVKDQETRTGYGYKYPGTKA